MLEHGKGGTNLQSQILNRQSSILLIKKGAARRAPVYSVDDLNLLYISQSDIIFPDDIRRTRFLPQVVDRLDGIIVAASQDCKEKLKAPLFNQIDALWGGW